MFRYDPYREVSTGEAAPSRSFLAAAGANEPLVSSEPLSLADFCNCGNCKAMTTREECTCCSDINRYHPKVTAGNAN